MSLVGEDRVPINLDGSLMNDRDTAIELVSSRGSESNIKAFYSIGNDATDAHGQTSGVGFYRQIKIRVLRLTDRVKHSMPVYVPLSCLAFSFWFSSLAGCEGEIYVLR